MSIVLPCYYNLVPIESSPTFLLQPERRGDSWIVEWPLIPKRAGWIIPLRTIHPALSWISINANPKPREPNYLDWLAGLSYVPRYLLPTSSINKLLFIILLLELLVSLILFHTNSRSLTKLLPTYSTTIFQNTLETDNHVFWLFSYPEINSNTENERCETRSHAH